MNNSIKNSIACLLSLLLFTVTIPALAFSDYSEKSAETLQELKILDGYEDGTFKPENKITRAEMAKIMATVDWIAATASDDGEVKDINSLSFNDVTPDDWFYNYVRSAASKSIIDGYDDRSFKPDNTITAAEAIKMCISLPKYDSIIKADYSTGESWYTPWMDAAVKYGLISENEFEPTTELNRGQVAELVYRAINMPLVVQVGGYSGDISDVALEFEICDGKSRAFDSLYNRFISNGIQWQQ